MDNDQRADFLGDLNAVGDPEAAALKALEEHLAAAGGG